MSAATWAMNWTLHPGDYIIAERAEDDRTFRILDRSTNEIETQKLVTDREREGRTILILQLKGQVP